MSIHLEKPWFRCVEHDIPNALQKKKKLYTTPRMGIKYKKMKSAALPRTFPELLPRLPRIRLWSRPPFYVVGFHVILHFQHSERIHVLATPFYRPWERHLVTHVYLPSCPYQLPGPRSCFPILQGSG
jgi:hypothetical protein